MTTKAGLREVTTDALTGIGDRRHGEQLLGSLVPGDVVVMLDLDHVEHVNDTYGHDYGDAVLAELGIHLRVNLRIGDECARYRDEEFLLVLRAVSEGWHAVVERLLDGWRARRPLTTLSVGAAVHRLGDARAQTVRRADVALHAAKRAGRDRAIGDSDVEVVTSLALARRSGTPAITI